MGQNTNLQKFGNAPDGCMGWFPYRIANKRVTVALHPQTRLNKMKIPIQSSYKHARISTYAFSCISLRSLRVLHTLLR